MIINLLIYGAISSLYISHYEELLKFVSDLAYRRFIWDCEMEIQDLDDFVEEHYKTKPEQMLARWGMLIAFPLVVVYILLSVSARLK